MIVLKCFCGVFATPGAPRDPPAWAPSPPENFEKKTKILFLCVFVPKSLDNEISGNSPTELFKEYLETEENGCRLWEQMTDQMSWQITHAADVYLKAVPDML